MTAVELIEPLISIDCHVTVYIDDILVTGCTDEEHLDALEKNLR